MKLRHAPPTQCDAAVRALIEVTGWVAAPERAPTDGVVVGLGLREGHEPDARQHLPEEVAQQLAARGADGWEYRAAWPVSARLVDVRVRWYAEIGVVVQADPKPPQGPPVRRSAGRAGTHPDRRLRPHAWLRPPRVVSPGELFTIALVMLFPARVGGTDPRTLAAVASNSGWRA
ncbi:hypothetical protein ACWDRB_47655 [Nonomuraea sp. NPDC003707]